MAHKIRKIQRAEVNAFLDKCDQSKPIVPVILDDAGLPVDEKEGKKYVRALFSNPEKLGKRCVVSSNCKRFLNFVSKDEELRNKVEFVNIYLADGIHNTAGGKKECTIYIMPEYSFGKQLFASFFKVFRKYVLKKKAGLKEWIQNKEKILRILINLGISSLAIIFMYYLVEFLGKMEDLKIIWSIISFLCEKWNTMNTGLQIVLAACVVVILSCIIIQNVVKNADSVCAQDVGKRGDNYVYFFPMNQKTHNGSFEQRWLDRNGLYREVEESGKKKKRFFYYGDSETNLFSEDDVSAVNLAKPGDNLWDGYRFLFAVLEHFSSLKQEIKLQYHPNTLVRSENDIES